MCHQMWCFFFVFFPMEVAYWKRCLWKSGKGIHDRLVLRDSAHLWLSEFPGVEGQTEPQSHPSWSRQGADCDTQAGCSQKPFGVLWGEKIRFYLGIYLVIRWHSRQKLTLLNWFYKANGSVNTRHCSFNNVMQLWHNYEHLLKPIYYWSVIFYENQAESVSQSQHEY